MSQWIWVLLTYKNSVVSDFILKSVLEKKNRDLTKFRKHLYKFEKMTYNVFKKNILYMIILKAFTKTTFSSKTFLSKTTINRALRVRLIAI